jgi:hypothetical protein
MRPAGLGRHPAPLISLTRVESAGRNAYYHPRLATTPFSNPKQLTSKQVRRIKNQSMSLSLQYFGGYSGHEF